MRLLGLALLFATQATAAPTVHVTSPESIALNRPFSDATEVGGVLYLSGQIGAVPGQDRAVPRSSSNAGPTPQGSGRSLRLCGA